MTPWLMNARIALRSVREQGARAVLSATGVFVAVVAIVLLVSIALGVRKDLTEQVEGLGVNVLVVLPARIQPGAMQFNPNLGGQSFLREAFAEDLRRVPGVRHVATLSFAGGGVRAGEREAYPILIATTSEWFRMHPLRLREGAPFTDPRSEEPVAVVGSVAARELFGDGPALDQPIQINGRPYRVVAVTEDREADQSLFAMGGFQNVIYIPFHEAKRHSPNQQIDRFMIQSAPDAEPKALVARLERVLGQRLDRQQYSVLTQEDILGLVYRVMSILTWLLTGLTSIALFVAGVGIMAVMLMAVGERTKEIGVRKTAGARRADVFQQFLIEAVLISLAGGAAGFALSAGVCWALAAYTDIKPLVTGGVVSMALGVSLGLGALFGLLPAMNAARKDPVDCLRRD